LIRLKATVVARKHHDVWTAGEQSGFGRRQ